MNAVGKEILLILDLDETLIHASARELRPDFDFQLYHYYVYKRPYLDGFIRYCAQHFRLAVWSSASDDYVQQIVKEIFPADIQLEFVWGRSRCTPALVPYTDEFGFYNLDYSSQYEYAKRLKKVRRLGYDLQRVLIVDDTPFKVLSNYGNAIYPVAYTGQLDDNELLSLTKYLATLKDVVNVRTIEKRGWQKLV
ncbi:NIF family HAD-type phosphatase [Hymenobacter lucidus]|uniref:HAD family hydrolase n=1 Tax=Hymenobacter lucidus TaxID=2880930 RepID=A0ABS8APX5_9BACT|nr:HAD family hydrolase [Hymenobacter lucidus]MCB2408260.1 HAD family hydrolase [Hymenobacter lucidus]